MSADGFARERLGWWAPTLEHKADHPIPEEIWDACVSDTPHPEGKTAFGVKFTSDGAEVILAGAIIPPEGKARITLIDRKPTGYGTQWLADWLNARYEKASCVVIDGKNGVDVLIDKIRPIWIYKDSVVKPRATDVIAAAGFLERQQDMLRDSAITSIKRPIAGGWGFGGEDPAPIEACALALYGAKTSKRNPSREMIIG